MSLSSTRRASVIHLTGALFWAVEILELFLIASLAVAIAATLAGRRFSEEKDKWFVSKAIYSVHPLLMGDLMRARETGACADAVKIGSAATTENQVDGQAQVAHLKEKPVGIVTVKAKTDKNKGLQPVFERELPNADLRVLWPTFPMPNESISPVEN